MPHMSASHASLIVNPRREAPSLKFTTCMTCGWHTWQVQDTNDLFLYNLSTLTETAFAYLESHFLFFKLYAINRCLYVYL